MTAFDPHTASPPDVRCPSCGARSTAGVSWCSLCFADLTARPEPRQPEVVPESVVPESTGVPHEPAAEVDGPALDALMAELAARERPASRFSALSGLVSSPGARVALMLGGTVLVSAFGFGLMAALGSLL